MQARTAVASSVMATAGSARHVVTSSASGDWSIAIGLQPAASSIKKRRGRN